MVFFAGFFFAIAITSMSGKSRTNCYWEILDDKILPIFVVIVVVPVIIVVISPHIFIIEVHRCHLTTKFFTS
ncbi:MAG: hypothetical protein ACFFE6_01380 [Candidatus Thorarchaeota archaeon]